MIEYQDNVKENLNLKLNRRFFNLSFFSIYEPKIFSYIINFKYCHQS